jgi:hypothetical protein
VGRPFRLSAPVVREHPIQSQIARVLTIELAPAGKVSAAGVVWFSIDHANYAGEVPGVRLGRGIIAGILDTFVLWRGLAHMIEIKAADGELSDAQRSVAAAVLASGGRVGVARDATETLACLDQWQIPRKHRVRIAA